MKTFLILQYSTLESTVGQYNWHIHRVKRQEESLTGEGKEVRDSRGEGLSAIGDGGQGAVSLSPDFDGTGSVLGIETLNHCTLSSTVQ